MIQNFEKLSTSALRRDALSIAETGYRSINICEVVKKKMLVTDRKLHIADKIYNLDGRNIYFVGIGKCAFAAARSFENAFGDLLTGGIALDVSETNIDGIKKIGTKIGTHPLSSETNVRETARIIEFLSAKNENDLVIFVISGGGSVLLCLPDEQMACSDESVLFKELTARGAPIGDINVVRKHTSRARGGGLAAAAYPAEIISLIVSDVPGNDVSVIASGPTVLDTTTVEDAKNILAHYGIENAKAKFIETPKNEDYFARVTNILFITSDEALAAMNSEALRLGYNPTIADKCLSGEARDNGRLIAERLHSASPKSAILYAGESTVTLGSSQGSGGRNQEMALAALKYLAEDELILPFASDGRDNTDHAGAIADIFTCARATELNISIDEYLDSHRSYDFFSAVGDALITGYTGTNVSDLIIALKK